MNRLFALALTATLIVYWALYLYDNTDDPRLDTILSFGLALGFSIGALHMLADRTWREWSPTAISILMLMVAMGTLFGLLFYQRHYGRLEPGVMQAWVDVVRATAVVGLPLFLIVIVRYRVHKWQGKRAIRPSDQLNPEWDGHTERRVGPADRRELA